MDGDTVTISTLADGISSGALLATREFQSGEVASTNSSVSFTLTSAQPMTVGLVDSTDTLITQTMATTGTVTLDANGNDLTTCKLAIWYSGVGTLPFVVAVSGVTGSDPVVPTTGNWVLNDTNVASGTVDGDSVTITSLTEAGGDILATREFQTGELVENANYVSATVHTDQDITFAILDTTDSVADSATVTANSTETVSFNVGVPIAGYKLAVLNNFLSGGSAVVTPATVAVAYVTTMAI